MGEMRGWSHVAALSALLVAAAAAGLAAHETEYRGTVAAVDKARVQVKTVDKDGKPTGKSEWFAVTAKTEVSRGKTVMASPT